MSILANGARAHVAMLVFAFLVSTSFTVGRAITDAVDPAALTFVRFAIAGTIFLALLALSRDRLTKLQVRDVGRYIWLALTLVVFFVTMFEALRLTDALSTGVVFTLCPMFTAIMSRMVLGQVLTGTAIISLIVAGCGAVWVMFDGDPERLARFSLGPGELIFLVGVFCYAAYSPSVRLLKGDRSLIEVTFWTILAGMVLLGLYARTEILATAWSDVPLTVYLGILHLAFFTTAISFYLIQYASVRLPSAKVMAYTYLIPAFVLAQDVVLGQPWPSLSVLGGVVVITAAMILLQRSREG